MSEFLPHSLTSFAGIKRALISSLIAVLVGLAFLSLISWVEAKAVEQDEAMLAEAAAMNYPSPCGVYVTCDAGAK